MIDPAPFNRAVTLRLMELLMRSNGFLQEVSADMQMELPDGWSYSEYEDALLRPGPGGVTKLAAPRNKLSWRPLIEDFEFKEGARWTPEQIAAMQSKLTIAARIPDAGVCFAGCACVRCKALGNADNPNDPVWLSQNGLMQINNAGAARRISSSVADDPASFDGVTLVTPEMIAAAGEADDDDRNVGVERYRAIYRAMHAVAPVPLVSEAEDRVVVLEGAIRNKDIALNSACDAMESKDGRIAVLEAENAHLRAEVTRLADGPPTQHPPEFVAKVLMDREGRDDPMALARLTEVIRCARLDGRKQARDELAAAESPGSHDYHGPVKDGRAIPDPTHERFHGAVGDVIAGRILPAARRQMQEALKQAPTDAPTTASTARPMPGKALGVAGQTIGLRLP